MPRVAVNIGPDSQYVYVVNAGNVVEQHAVKVLFDDGANMAVQSDIKTGDRVIIDGALRALPGGKVAIAGTRPQTMEGPPDGAMKAEAAKRGRRKAAQSGAQ